MKKLVASLLSAVIMFALLSPVYANSVPNLSDEQVLLNFGYDAGIVETMEPTARHDLAEAIRIDPDSVDFSQSVYSFDETYEIREYVTSSDEQLAEKGFTQADIAQIRNTIQDLSNSTDQQLKEKYNRSDLDVRALRIALEPGLPLPRSISSSQLTFSVSKNDLGDKPVAYQFVVSFNWNTLPWLHLDDKVAMGWGGNLATRNASSSGTYVNSDTGSYQYYSASHSESPINAGYTCTYSRQRGDKVLRSGTVVLGLYQNYRQGTASKFIAIYGHQTVVGTIGVTISASPSVSFSLKGGWDFSGQVDRIITY